MLRSGLFLLQTRPRNLVVISAQPINRGDRINHGRRIWIDLRALGH